MPEFQPQLNRQSPLALYYQLKRILLNQIDNKLEDGEKLPSESELAKQYSVSRHVVRRALNELVVEGKVTAIQGAGYFINKPRIRKALLTLGSHTKSIATLGQSTSTRVVSLDIVDCPEHIREKLLPENDYQAVFLERVSYLNNEPVSLIRAYYPLEFASTLLGNDLNNRSVYTLLKEKCFITPKHAHTVISVVYSDVDQSHLLNIREGIPLFQLRSFTWAENDKVFEFSSGYYRIDRFELEFQQN